MSLGSAKTRDRYRWIALAFAAAFCVGLLVQQILVQHGRAEARAQRELQTAANLIAAQNGELVGAARELLEVLAQLPEVRAAERDPQRCSNILGRAERVTQRYAFIGFVDAAGDLICGAPNVVAPRQTQVRDRLWFRRVMATGAFSIGEYVIGRSSGKPSIHFAAPVRNDAAEIVGAVNVGLDLAWMADRLAQLSFGPNYVVSLFDGNGHLLARYPDAERLAGMKIPPELLARSASARAPFDAVGPAGTSRTFAAAVVSGDTAPLHLALGVPQADFAAAVRRETARSFVPVGAVLLAALLALALGAWTLRSRSDARERIWRDRLRQQELLFQEVHHRVKNNLQMVLSLVRLSRSNDASLDDLAHRIQAMSQLHEYLYRTRSSGRIDLGGYLGKLARHVQSGNPHAARIRIAVAAQPGITIASEQALSVGLIVSELTMNALKHAFPDGAGHIAITAARDGADVVVGVEDDGRGMTAGGDGSGIGIKLIDALTRQLDGSLTMTSDGGTRFALRFPAPEPAGEVAAATAGAAA